jgi:hypothetical protein
MAATHSRLNLNNVGIPTDGPIGHTTPFTDFGLDSGDVSVHFKRLDLALVKCLAQYPYVVGCVAWLTNEDILEALSLMKGVGLVVLKEDFLRPDVGAEGSWQERLREKYRRVPSLACHRFEVRGLLKQLSVCGDPAFDAIRCVGVHNASKKTSPRAHHKFVVFCDGADFGSEPTFGSGVGDAEGLRDSYPRHELQLIPRAVWTGSFNFTKNGLSSLENAVVIRRRDVAKAFFNEWEQVYAISEPLDWTDPWVAPEWRIGT